MGRRSLRAKCRGSAAHAALPHRQRAERARYRRPLPRRAGGRADAHAMFRAWKQDVPAFADAYFLEAYPWIGVRESRRIVGQYVLHEDDLMKGHRFDDAIATGCWYLDLHPNKTVVGSANDFDPKKVQPEPYDIPFRSLMPQKIE